MTYQPTRSDIKHEKEYLANNMIVVRAGSNCKTRIFRNLLCGHEKEVHTTDAKRSMFRCDLCNEDRWNQEANAAGLTFINKIGLFDANYRFKDCGHEQTFRISNVRHDKFRCKQCQDKKLSDEASAVGITFIEKIDNKVGRYKFNECNHEQIIHSSNVRVNSFQCHSCEKTWANVSSNLYLHKIEYGTTTLLKFGRARNVEKRSVQYGLAVGSELKILQVWPMPTGIEADRIETMVSKQFKRYNKSKAKLVLQDSGWTECYKVDDQYAIMDFVTKQINQLSFSQS